MAGIALRCPNPDARNTFSRPVERARVVLGGIRRAWYHRAKNPVLALAIVAEAAIVCRALPNPPAIY